MKHALISKTTWFQEKSCVLRVTKLSLILVFFGTPCIFASLALPSISNPKLAMYPRLQSNFSRFMFKKHFYVLFSASYAKAEIASLLV